MSNTIPANSNAAQAPLQDALARRILEAIGSLRHGTVEGMMDDGHVVRIDRKERIRVERPAR